MGSWGWLLAFEVFLIFGVVLLWAWRELVLVERARRRSRERRDEGEPPA